MDAIEGGMILPVADFWMGSARGAHTTEQEGRPVSQVDLDATNTLGLTGWRINRRVLEVAQTAWDLGHPCIGLDAAVAPPVPERTPDDVWAAMGYEDRRKATSMRSEGWDAIKSWQSQVVATDRLLVSAQADRDHAHLYICWGHDARLRRYPRVSSGPNPQGSGLSRALLEFSTGKPLGSRGLFWLAVRAATAAGLDKLDHNARAAWADEHTETLRACAREPFAYDFWWKDRDDPWALLATCFELNDALNDPRSPAAYVSRLAVQVDGTCNGLQHLSALGLDTRGAVSTNLSDDPTRHDIYAEVAGAVNALLGRDVAAGNPLALQWVGRVDRNRVKRGVMTTTYGVTQRGMRDQLIEAGDVPGDDMMARSEAAGYLRDLMWTAMGETAGGAREIMDWLQATATVLGNANKPFRWETPTGSVVQQAYRPWVVVRPVTVLGQVTVASKIDKTAIKARKQALAAAPNFVHSFDAAHMALTINECSRRGVTHFSMVHDSFGTHAADMDTMAAALRETFVSIYRDENWLDRTHRFARGDAPGVDLPAPPRRGEFNLDQVLRSPWFFA